MPRNLDPEIELKWCVFLDINVNSIETIDIFIRSLIRKWICKVIFWKNTSGLLMSIIRARYIARPRTIISKYLGKYLYSNLSRCCSDGLEYVIVNFFANSRFKV